VIAGAYVSADSNLGQTGPDGDSSIPGDGGGGGGGGGNNSPSIGTISGTLKNAKGKTKVMLTVAVSDLDGDLQSVSAKITPTKKGSKAKNVRLQGSSGTFTGQATLPKGKKFKVAITAKDSEGHTTKANGKLP
jgi:hypothetical protein